MLSRYVPAKSGLLLSAVAAALLLSACAEPAAPPAVPPKPVKIEVAGGGSLHGTDSFVGTLRARQRTDLSFESPGRIIAIKTDLGDRVRAGQVLAQLDEAPARLRLAQAQAGSEASAAALTERKNHLRQQEALARDAIISPAALEAVQASYKQAQSQHAAAAAAVAAAKRDLSLARITAPFDGEIVSRQAQPFVDVAAGQAILQLESHGAMELVVMLPDTVAAGLAPGTRAHALAGKDKLALILERVSRRSDNGSLVQAVFRLAETYPNVRSGATVSLELPRVGAPAITLPATALMAGPASAQASLFVVESGVLKRRTVQVDKRVLPGGRVAVVEGLRGGEQVVVAGAAFLHDDQAVVAHRPLSTLTGAQP